MTRSADELRTASLSSDHEVRLAAIDEMTAHADDPGVRIRLRRLLSSHCADTASAATRALLVGAGIPGLALVLEGLVSGIDMRHRETVFRTIATVRGTTWPSLFRDMAVLARQSHVSGTSRAAYSLLLYWNSMQLRPIRIAGADAGERSALAALLDGTHDSDPLMRGVAMEELGDFGSDPLVVGRLAELLDADTIETVVLAAEILLRRCGVCGLEVVMDELVRRKDDGQMDYIWEKMSEVQETQSIDVYRDAYSYAVRLDSDEMLSIVGLSIESWNRVQNRPETMLRPDGTRHADGCDL